MEGDVVSTQEIFRFRRRGIAYGGSAVGSVEAVGVRPTFTERLQVTGIELPACMFALA